MPQDRRVQRAFDPRFKEAVEVDEPQNVFVVLAFDIHVPVENDLSFGKGAGLVTAENRHAAEVLDSGQLFD